MMNNTIDKLNALNINELNTVWSFINSVSEDFTAAGEDAISEKLDELLDTIMEHIEYREADMEALHNMEEREAEMEALHNMEEAERNKFF